MGESGMNAFTKDDHWQKKVREKVLKPFYQKKGFEHRFVFTDKGRLAEVLQKEYAVDTLIQTGGNEVISIEEKIVRWPGYQYTSFTLETWSCTTEGRERQGWMYTAKCDYLLYCFTQSDESAIAYLIPFHELQEWFFENNRYEHYRPFVTDQINHTETRIVPIRDVVKAVPRIKRIVLKPDNA